MLGKVDSEAPAAVPGSPGCTDRPRGDGLGWVGLGLAILALKLGVFWLDPTPQFFLGDSAAFLDTALNGRIPSNRSFTYGYFLRYTALAAGDLRVLVLVQTLLSAANALALALLAHRFFGIRRGVAAALALACAVEPMQLMFDRYVLTETTALSCFLAWLAASLSYLRTPGWASMILAQGLGILLVSLRISFLPLVLAGSGLVPLLAWPTWRRRFGPDPRRAIAATMISLLAWQAGTQAWHAAYRHWYGAWMDGPPKYLYESGYFALATLAPLVRPEDFPRPDLRLAIFGDPPDSLSNPRAREAQRWAEGGLVSRLRTAVGEELEADEIASQVARATLLRNPMGAARLLVRTCTDYFDRSYLAWTLRQDRGDRDLPPDLADEYRRVLLVGEDSLRRSPTWVTALFLHCAWWYRVLFVAPLLGAIAVLGAPPAKRPLYALVTISVVGVIAVACGLGLRPCVRYLHAVGWLLFLCLGGVLQAWEIRREQRLPVSL